MSLKEYARKRNFRKTAEPKGGRARRAGGYRFVIQKHDASRLHYDFRLELGGTLKSWAVPKGVPYKKGERRLAVHVEDHPVSYIDFEGTIPKGQYGGGTVMVWDRGTFEPLSETPAKDLAGGKLHFVLEGEKLRGEWYLVRLRDGDEWLLIKGGESMKPVTAKADDTSAVSGQSMKQISKGGGRVWESNRREKSSFKNEIVKAAGAKAAGAARRASANTKSKMRKREDDRNGAAAPVGAALRVVGSKTKQHGGRGSGRLGEPSLPGANTKTKTKTGAKTTTGAGTKTGAETKTGAGTKTGAETKTGAGSKTSTKSKLTPAFVEPMKAQLVDAAPAGEWVYEIKYDGFRAMAYRDRRGVRLLSRNNKDLGRKFPSVVEAIEALDVKDAVIDGEVVALDDQGRSSFQLLQAYEMGEQRLPLCFYAFDLLQLDGRDLQGLALVERKAMLEQLLEGGKGVVRYSVSLGTEAEPLLEQARKLRLEGLIGKRPESTYQAGRRSGDWIKLKLHQEQEFVIGGYTPPGGSRSHFGALLVGVYEEGGSGVSGGGAKKAGGARNRLQAGSYAGAKLKFAGKVGTGFDAKWLRTLHAQFEEIASETCPFVDLPEKRSGRYGQGVTAAEMRRCHWVKPTMVAQIKFAEWTRDDRLRQPVFLGLREDKAAKDVVREKTK